MHIKLWRLTGAQNIWIEAREEGGESLLTYCTPATIYSCPISSSCILFIVYNDNFEFLVAFYIGPKD